MIETVTQTSETTEFNVSGPFFFIVTYAKVADVSILAVCTAVYFTSHTAGIHFSFMLIFGQTRNH